MSYIRFQTNVRSSETGRWLGIFHAAGKLQDDEAVEPWLSDSLKETLQWFNQNLTVPRDYQVSKRCLFWFDRKSSEVIGAVWDLITILEQHDVAVTSRKCIYPGKIVYRDCHQVAAIPTPRRLRTLHQR